VIDSLRVAHSVTAVGGTVYIPEVAVDFSGGGFSNYVRLLFVPCIFAHLTGAHQFLRPSWQEAAVGKFLASLPKGTYEGYFNPSGRVWAHHFPIEF